MSSYYDRMATILHNDKLKMPKLVESAVKSDLVSAASQYITVDNDRVAIDIKTTDDGEVLIVASIVGTQLAFRSKQQVKN